MTYFSTGISGHSSFYNPGLQAFIYNIALILLRKNDLIGLFEKKDARAVYFLLTALDNSATGPYPLLLT